MNTSRRDFLRVGLSGLGVVCLGGSMPLFVPRFAHAATSIGTGVANDNILVVIQMSGGNDGLNTIIPVRDDLYHKARPRLHLTENLHKLNDDLSMNPGLESFKHLWDEGKLAVVQGCGYPKPNRSHFESMSIWETADPAGLRDGTGWLGHTLDHLRQGTVGKDIDQGKAGHEDGHDHPHDNPLLAVNIGDQLPQAFVTDGPPVPSIRNVRDFGFRMNDNDNSDNELEKKIMADLNAAREDESPAMRFLARQATNAMISADEIAKLTDDYRPDAEYKGGLGEQLRTVAQIISGHFGSRVFYCQIGGFDTHSNQAGDHERQLREMADAIAAFQKDLDAKGLSDKVTLMCFSEFGRRVGQNESNGTDHGTAGPMFVVGSKVKAGLHGTTPSLKPEDLDSGDLKFTTDFRRVYGSVLKNWLNVEPAAVLHEAFEPVGVV